jgi:hypothetical protein
MPLRVFCLIEQHGRKIRLDIPNNVPIYEIDYFKQPQVEYRIYIDFNYSGG